MNFLGFEHQALFAKDVAAGKQHVARDRKVGEQRRDDKDRVDIFALEQLVVILVRLRLAANVLTAVKLLLLISQSGHAAAAIDVPGA